MSLLYWINDSMYSYTELPRAMDFRSILRSEFGSRWQSFLESCIVLMTLLLHSSSSFLDTLRRPLTCETPHRYSAIDTLFRPRSPSKEPVFLFMRFLRRLAEFIRFALSTFAKSRIYSLKLLLKYGITKEIADSPINLLSKKNGDVTFWQFFPEMFLAPLFILFYSLFRRYGVSNKLSKTKFHTFCTSCKIEIEVPRLSECLFFSQISLSLRRLIL